MTTTPTPVNQLPWTQKTPLCPIYDANGKVVSFTENADFLMWLVRRYQVADAVSQTILNEVRQ